MTGRIYIIAEAGVNHNGDPARARDMIWAAARAGADAVKFQTFRTENLVIPSAAKADYQSQVTGGGESQFDMLKKLELDGDEFAGLQAVCREAGLDFLSTPFDLDSVDLLDRLGLETFKIPSGEITNLPYLRRIGGLRKKVLLSTGMADLEEVEAALNILTEAGTRREDVIVLHCTTEYPAPFEEANLLTVRTMAERLGVKTGYSDHTVGIEASIAAAALGAAVIEKHFTLDKTLPGPDHQSSLEPDELAALVRAVRNVELALGDGIKKPGPSEIRNRAAVRKGLVAARDIAQGQELTADDLAAKRIGAAGLSPMLWDRILGRRACRDFNQDEPLEL